MVLPAGLSLRKEVVGMVAPPPLSLEVMPGSLMVVGEEEEEVGVIPDDVCSVLWRETQPLMRQVV